jgi:hypothetical protein
MEGLYQALCRIARPDPKDHPKHKEDLTPKMTPKRKTVAAIF